MINVKVEEKEVESKKEYPCLKIHELVNGRNLIVLFTEPRYGVVINNQKSALQTWDIGYCGRWEEHDFKPFTGKITLSNEL